jgi:4-hydroxybenzoate polyprenyltransferase
LTALAWGRLLRLSLAPTAAADVVAGLVAGGGGRIPPALDAALLVASSLAVYHGGLVLNDWADRAEDAKVRPDRPIPSGAVSARAALLSALALFAVAIALASCVSWRAGTWVLGIALLASAYDLAGRGPWVGPLLLGGCRAANLGLGLYYGATLAGEPLGVAPPNAPWLLASYGLYVVSASRVARLEDQDPRSLVGRGPKRALVAGSFLLLAPSLLPARALGLSAPDLASLVLGVAGGYGMLRMALERRPWAAADCGRAAGAMLRRLLAFTAALAVASRDDSPDGWIAAGAILAGFAASAGLRKVFPPT